MESSNNLSRVSKIAKIVTAFFPFSDFFYILQQEEYSSARFLKWLPRFFFRRNFQVRDTLKYTKRVKSSFAFVIVIWLESFFLAAQYFSLRPVPALILAVIWLITIPLFVFAGNWVLSPYYNHRKKVVMRRAAAAVRAQKDLKIVAVAGSFGKTTTKNFIYQFTRFNFATQMVSGNINTPLGIAMWVNAYLKPGTQLLIVEMDAYQRGEIAASASIAPADVAIITNIGDQHLERFGSKAALALALREIFAGAKPGAKLLCTEETAAALGAGGSAGKAWEGSREMVTITDDALAIIPAAMKKNFSTSNQINLAFAVKAAQLLRVPKSFILDACAKIELPGRRQKEGEWHGYIAIDDTYNISLTTARAGLEAAAALAKRLGKKLVVVTAGIPELGPDEKDGNKLLGEAIAARADYAAILGSIFARAIAKGVCSAATGTAITAGNGVNKRYSIFKNLTAFLAKAPAQFPPEEWVVLAQPELTDLYY
jgi:UDP-N-acetylmuramoyl-tripeptide--D-alanyl-D-alanine ligase